MAPELLLPNGPKSDQQPVLLRLMLNSLAVGFQCKPKAG